ncbi:hypothetical protein D1007_04928 [Hordeum vulgare]|nr:hypothetical protein D1007_04928 [Hordeum vulgare]
MDSAAGMRESALDLLAALLTGRAPAAAADGDGGQSRRLLARADGEGRRPSFSGRCARLVKEQRARFYIMRRCVTMLVCWRDYA